MGLPGRVGRLLVAVPPLLPPGRDVLYSDIGYVVLWEAAERAVAEAEQVLEKVQEAHDVAPYSMVIVGNGTSSQKLIHEIREIMPSMAILAVDERDTSLQARERYWEHHPRRGWRRLLPATLQVPPDPVDDFVAYILAERVLSG